VEVAKGALSQTCGAGEQASLFRTFLSGNATNVGTSIRDMYSVHGGLQTNDARFFKTQHVRGRLQNFGNSDLLVTLFVWKAARDNGYETGVSPYAMWEDYIDKQTGGSPDQARVNTIGQKPWFCQGWNRDFDLVKKWELSLSAGAWQDLDFTRHVKRADPPDALGYGVEPDPGAITFEIRPCVKGYTWGIYAIFHGELGVSETTPANVGSVEGRLALMWDANTTTSPAINVSRQLSYLRNDTDPIRTDADTIINKAGEPIGVNIL